MKKLIALILAVLVTESITRMMAATNEAMSLPATSPYGEARVLRNISYTTNAVPRQNFDLYLPAKGAQPFTLVLWIHGGAWMGGNKEMDSVKYLVRHGYALASMDYRMSDAATFPAQIQDCNACLNFILAHAAEYGVDGRQFVVGGSSAGGHLALLLGLARQQTNFGANPAIAPAAILDFFGPADLTKGRAELEAIHSDRGVKLFDVAIPKLLGVPVAQAADRERLASPINYVTTNSPPVILLQGDHDELVPIADSRQLHAVLDQAGVANRLMELPGAGHGGPQFNTPEIEAAVVAFLDGVLKQPSRYQP